MAKTKIELLNNEVITSRVMEHFANDKKLSKDEFKQVVLKELIDEYALNKKAQSNLKANLGNVMKKLIEQKLINFTDAKPIATPVKQVKAKKAKTPTPEVVKLTDDPLEEQFEVVSQKAHDCILKYFKKNIKPTRKQIMEDVPKLMGITPAEAKQLASNTKYSRYKSVIGIQLAQLIQNNVILYVNENEQEFYVLAEVNKKSAKKTITRKKESPKEDKSLFLDAPNKKMLINFEEYKKIKQKHDEQQKVEILNALCMCDSAIFEKLCVNLVCHFYSVDNSCGAVNGGCDDRGIDGYVTVKDPLGFPPKKLAIQCKCFKDPKKGCTPTLINSFYGSMTRKNIRKGFIFTTGIFDQKAVKKQFTDENGTCVMIDRFKDEKNYDFGKNERMIICIDGKTIVEYMVHYKVGIKFMNNDIVGLDDEYFKNKEL